MNETQTTELTYALITNEFDIARLKNVVNAEPGRDRGGYIFHNVYHISLPLLRETHGERFKDRAVGWHRQAALAQQFLDRDAGPFWRKITKAPTPAALLRLLAQEWKQQLRQSP